MKSLRALTVALALVVGLVPAFALAQQTCGTTWQNWGNVTCAPGNLLVYVQVNNNNNGYNRAPSDFTVTVSAPTVSPSTFTGSLQGTSVLVGGNYSVNVLQQQGYTASYSTGCSGYLSQNASATCIVTESNTAPYNTYPYTYYPNQYYPSYYPYSTGYSIPLTCSPSGQTVTIGQNVTFTAQGGDYSQYNWFSSAQPRDISYNMGRTFTTTLLSPGTQNITVTNGQQTAVCSVTVVGYPVQGYNYPTYINPITTVPVVGGIYNPVTVTPSYVPRLPNTGFEPIDGATLAIALALMFAAALAAYPYVRQAFATVLR